MHATFYQFISSIVKNGHTLKRFILYLIISAGLLIILPGCSNEEPVNTPANIISISVGRNETVHYDLGYFGYEEGAFINTQASHYLVSKTDRDINTGKIMYTYTPAHNFTGTDEVVLKSMRGSDGASANNNIILTTIKFNISN